MFWSELRIGEWFMIESNHDGDIVKVFFLLGKNTYWVRKHTVSLIILRTNVTWNYKCFLFHIICVSSYNKGHYHFGGCTSCMFLVAIKSSCPCFRFTSCLFLATVQEHCVWVRFHIIICSEDHCFFVSDHSHSCF